MREMVTSPFTLWHVSHCPITSWFYQFANCFKRSSLNKLYSPPRSWLPLARAGSLFAPNLSLPLSHALSICCGSITISSSLLLPSIFVRNIPSVEREGDRSIPLNQRPFHSKNFHPLTFPYLTHCFLVTCYVDDICSHFVYCGIQGFDWTRAKWHNYRISGKKDGVKKTKIMMYLRNTLDIYQKMALTCRNNDFSRFKFCSFVNKCLTIFDPRLFKPLPSKAPERVRERCPPRHLVN